MKFGIVDKIFYNEYLSEHLCSSCKQNFSTKLVVHCKAFATGFAWWAWNKQGYIECTSCGAITDIKSGQVHAKGIRSAFSLKSLPLYYFLPTVLVGTIVALLLLGITINIITKATTTEHDRFEGIWAAKMIMQLCLFLPTIATPLSIVTQLCLVSTNSIKKMTISD